jgi:cellulose synthase/poly-beta-1,6-N-acetylglucosamine synthase-like glycosyltransferase
MITPPMVVFLLGTAFVFYVLAGYPIVLGVLARLRTRPVGKRSLVKSVSVLLPVYNGEAWLEAKLASLLALDYPRDQVEILVVSDGSTDRTVEIASAFAGQGVRVLAVPHAGKAAALNTALAEARGDILLFTDVRQPLEAPALRELVECFADPEVGVASGELVLLGEDTDEKASVGLYWRYEKWIRKRMARLDSFLGATGAIYAMRRDLARELPPDTLLDDVYLPLAAFFAGYRVVFDERARAFDRVSALPVEFHRKVRTLAGVYQVIGFYPALLGPRNRMWFHFVSHKFGRMLLPWALLVMALSSIWLPEGWRAAAWFAQLSVYMLALIDSQVPPEFPGKPMSAAARTFVVLMAATLCSVAILFLPARRLWKIGEQA